MTSIPRCIAFHRAVRAIVCCLLLASGWAHGTPALQAAAPAEEEAQPLFDPRENYEPRTIEGWSVLVNRRALTDERLETADRTLRHLGDHLYRITHMLPAAAVVRLREIPIWVEWAHPKHPCMCYHPDAQWLEENGMNPEKAGTVELANCVNFLEWTKQQPWMILHELAHGYHDQAFGYDDPLILDAFERAKAAGVYEQILHWNGEQVRHYALTNQMEYFAELTEAYFGTNDFYPFVRAELEQVDPFACEMLRQVYLLDEEPSPSRTGIRGARPSGRGD